MIRRLALIILCALALGGCAEHRELKSPCACLEHPVNPADALTS